MNTAEYIRLVKGNKKSPCETTLYKGFKLRRV